MADTPALAVRCKCGYRRITAMLCQEGWRVNHKRVERIWRREGLKVPAKQPKRGRLWLNDGSIVRLRAEFSKHVWSYDFMEDRTHNGVKFRILNIIDKFTRECLAVRVGRSLTHQVVIEVLTELFIERGPRSHSLGQWFGIHCQKTAKLAEETGRQTALHRAGQPLGERVC